MNKNEYSLNINHDYKVVFYHIPKTAGTSIKNTLGMDSGFVPYFLSDGAKNFDEVKDGYQKFSVVRNPYSRFISLYNYRKLRKYDNWIMGEEYDFNTWMKNPFVKGPQLFKTLSDYFYFIDNFYDYMLNEDVRTVFNAFTNDYIPYNLWLSDSDGNIKMNFVLHQENLNQQFKEVFTESKELSKKNTYNSNLKEFGENNTLKVIDGDYTSVYNRESLDIVNRVHEKDFKLFKYEML